MATTQTKTAAQWQRYDELNAYHDRVISRIEEKGETLAQAIEAVIGDGKGRLFNAIVAFTYGKR